MALVFVLKKTVTSTVRSETSITNSNRNSSGVSQSTSVEESNRTQNGTSQSNQREDSTRTSEGTSAQTTTGNESSQSNGTTNTTRMDGAESATKQDQEPLYLDVEFEISFKSTQPVGPDGEGGCPVFD